MGNQASWSNPCSPSTSNHEYLKLEGTHKGYQGQLLAYHKESCAIGAPTPSSSALPDSPALLAAPTPSQSNQSARSLMEHDALPAASRTLRQCRLQQARIHCRHSPRALPFASPLHSARHVRAVRAGHAQRLVLPSSRVSAGEG